MPIRYPHPSLSDTSHTHSVYLTRRGVCIHMLSPCKTRGTYMHSVYRTGRDVHIYIPPCSAQGELCCPHIPSCKISHMTAPRASHREGCHVTFIRSVHIHPPCMARIYRPAAPAGISAITDRHPRLQPHSSHTHTRVRARAPLCTPLCTLRNLTGRDGCAHTALPARYAIILCVQCALLQRGLCTHSRPCKVRHRYTVCNLAEKAV